MLLVLGTYLMSTLVLNMLKLHLVYLLFINYNNHVIFFSILAKCIDYYTQQCIALADGVVTAKPVDPRLEEIVNRMFQRCLDDGQYRQALGLALETRRMDIFEASITQSDDVAAMLSYAFQVGIIKVLCLQ